MSAFILRILIAFLLISLVPVQTMASGWDRAFKAFGESMSEYGNLMMQEELRRREYERRLQQQIKLEAARQEREREIERERQEREMELEEERSRNAVYTGTGFFVSQDGHIVTNAHVVEDKHNIAVRTLGDKFYRATVIGRDHTLDLALLQVETSSPSLQVVSSKTVAKGQRVLALGYPHISIQGNESKVTDGIISSFSGYKGDSSKYQISVPVQSGNSGGPLFNESGQVVGVIVAKIEKNEYENVSYAIKSDILLNFLKDHSIVNSLNNKKDKSIQYVDSATVLVIASNRELKVTYEQPPINIEREERLLTELHPDWRTVSVSDDFKHFIGMHPRYASYFSSNSGNDKAKAIAAFKKHDDELRRQQEVEVAERKKEQDRLDKLQDRDNEILKHHKDWDEISGGVEFKSWLARNPLHRRTVKVSLEPGPVISVIDKFKKYKDVELVEVSRVGTIYSKYNYLTFPIDGNECVTDSSVYLLVEGFKAEGVVSKCIGGKASATFDNSLKQVKTGDPVYFESR